MSITPTSHLPQVLIPLSQNQTQTPKQVLTKVDSDGDFDGDTGIADKDSTSKTNTDIKA